ncbi:MAG: hypothetical protein OXI67_10870 [Candidatus Poribacteria bacterium]|nr:hypothetical protein [Candidatus Poribacteria bacterium]
MDKKQWSIAHDIAFDLVDWGTDPNELGKVVAFMRRYKGESDAKNRLMSLIQRLANTRNALIRSRQTQRFYRNIQEACETHLYDVSDTGEILTILGWSLRLMRYYRVEPERAVEEQRLPQTQQQTPKQPPTQTSQRPKAPEKPKVKVGARVNATILKKDGFKVTVQLQTDENEELVFERPYYPGVIGAKVKLRVTDVDDTGKINGVIP